MLQNAQTIIKTLGGSATTGMCNCPAHDDKTPSLHVTARDGKVLVKCHAGCSQDAVIGALKSRNLWPTHERKERQISSRQEDDDEERREKIERQRKAREIWREARDIDDDARAYFKGRGIEAVPANARYLTRQEARKLTGKLFAAIVMPIVKPRDLTSIGFPKHDAKDRVGVQLTFLTRDETANARGRDGKSLRKAFGLVAGGFIPLAESDPDGPLLVGEGVETVLSAMQVADLPGIAARSAGNMAKIDLPPSSEIIILADRDENGTGLKSAKEAARRWTSAGRVVRIALPPKGCSDFNDALRAGIDPDELKRAILEANPEDADDDESMRAEIGARLDELAALDQISYDQKREAAAKELGIRVSTLDREVAKRFHVHDDDDDGFLEPVKPWDDAVDGAELLDELHDIFNRHIIFANSHAKTACALFVLHAHAHMCATHSPILFITSPTKRCGKTNLLSVVSMLVPKPLSAANVTAATVFRAIERWRPTLLIDEVDTFFEDRNDLRGVLNSGHKKGVAYVLRCVGDDIRPKAFSVWSPKVFASIGRIHPTLEDRSITIELKRKLRSEQVDHIPEDDYAYEEWRRKAARWALDNEARLKGARPDLPDLHDRARDNWRPLIAIADLAGGDWPKLAREAAVALSGADDDETQSILLLRDLQKLFTRYDDENLSSAFIAERLATMEDRPWPAFAYGKPITPHGIARLLKDFNVRPRQIRLPESGKRGQGYLAEQFRHVFKRYLQEDGKTSSTSPDKPIKSKAYDKKKPVTGSRAVRGRKAA